MEATPLNLISGEITAGKTRKRRHIWADGFTLKDTFKMECISEDGMNKQF